MPTKKRRVGFIPRSDVLEIINQLSFESNLSNSKIINILVEEALQKRGIFNIKTSQINNNESIESLAKDNKKISKNNTKPVKHYFNNKLIEHHTLEQKKINYASLDLEIYEKFLMFLQFEKKMKNDI